VVEIAVTSGASHPTCNCADGTKIVLDTLAAAVWMTPAEISSLGSWNISKGAPVPTRRVHDTALRVTRKCRDSRA
jgi:hypothetical protein